MASQFCTILNGFKYMGVVCREREKGGRRRERESGGKSEKGSTLRGRDQGLGKWIEVY